MHSGLLRMNNPHKNARTTPLDRAEMVRRIKEGQPVAAVAAGFGISERTARKWLERFEKEGPPGLENRSSRPREVANRTGAPWLVDRAAAAGVSPDRLGDRRKAVHGPFDRRRLADAPGSRAACGAGAQGARAPLSTRAARRAAYPFAEGRLF